MRKLVSSLKNDLVGSLATAAVWAFVVFWFVLFGIAVVTISIGTPGQRSRAYEIIVPGEKLHYYCDHVDHDGDALTLIDCESSPRVVIENQVNVQIIERKKKQ